MKKRKPAKGQMPLLFDAVGAHDEYWQTLAERESVEAERTPATVWEGLQAAQLIGTVTGLPFAEAEEIIRQAGGVHRLAQAPGYALANLPGLDPEKAAQIRAMSDWGLMLSSAHEELTTMKVKMPADIAQMMMLEMGLLDHEELRVVSLDTRNYVAGIDTLYQGSVNMVVVRVAEILRPPIARQCPFMIMLHNHPSGDPSPSPDDVRLTKLVAETARQMDIQLLDHLIIGRSSFVSLQEKGLGFD